MISVARQQYTRTFREFETGSVYGSQPIAEGATALDKLWQRTFRNWLLSVGALAVSVVAGIIAVTGVLASDPFGNERANGSALAVPSTGDLSSSTIEHAAAKAVPSVVKLEIKAGRQSKEGSGIVLTADGLILTGSHVVSGFGARLGLDGVKSTVTFADGRLATFSMVGDDPITDVAIVRAQDISGLRPITLGSSANLHVGKTVLAVGAPLGFESTVTTGVISGLHRPVLTPPIDTSGHQTVLDAIQTDAALNPGSSGGALIDGNGDLIGLNSLMATAGGSLVFGPSGSIGLGFAIPVDQVKHIMGELVATGKASHAYLGVRLVRDADIRGAKIVEAKRGSPAAAAGLGAGMVITRMDDRVIASAEALVAVILSKTPSNTVTLACSDVAGASRTIQLALASDRVGSDDDRDLIEA